MLQFFGTYNHKVDEKGRVALPMKFRKTYDRAKKDGEIESTDLVAIPSPAKAGDKGSECIFVFTPEDFNTWVNSLFEMVGGINPRNKEHELLNRSIRAQAEGLSIDSANRINLPQKLLDVAGINKDVALVGNDGRFEIWDAKRIDTTLESIDLEKLFYE